MCEVKLRVVVSETPSEAMVRDFRWFGCMPQSVTFLDSKSSMQFF